MRMKWKRVILVILAIIGGILSVIGSLALLSVVHPSWLSSWGIPLLPPILGFIAPLGYFTLGGSLVELNRTR